MTLGVSNVSRIHFLFEFIVNPDPDPIIESPSRCVASPARKLTREA